MTREERYIAVLNRLLENMDVYDSIQPTTERKKAIKAAIKALENHDTFMKYAYSQGKHDALSQESCDDAIDREYLFKVLDDFCGHDRTATITLDTLADLVYDMPPVTQKSGKWIKVTNGRGGHECDICHEYAPSYQDGDEYLTKFCPNCGAKMVEPQESEEISERNMKMWEEIFKAERR